MSTFHRSGLFDSDDEPQNWSSQGATKPSWIRPPSFATAMSIFWAVVFVIAMFWHRGGKDQGLLPSSAVSADIYGSDPYSISLPVFYPPSFDYESIYKRAYAMYMKSLMDAARSESGSNTQSRATTEIPSEVAPQEKAQPLADTALQPDETQSVAAPAATAPAAMPDAMADITSAHFTPTVSAPHVSPARVTALPSSNMAQKALHDQAQAAANLKTDLKVAPVGLPGFEPNTVSVPQGTVRSAYPKANAAIEPSDQQNPTQN